MTTNTGQDTGSWRPATLTEVTAAIDSIKAGDGAYSIVREDSVTFTVRDSDGCVQSYVVPKSELVQQMTKEELDAVWEWINSKTAAIEPNTDPTTAKEKPLKLPEASDAELANLRRASRDDLSKAWFMLKSEAFTPNEIRRVLGLSPLPWL